MEANTEAAQAVPPQQPELTPEQKRRVEIRGAHTALLMADFDALVQRRLRHLMAALAERAGLPTRITLHTPGAAPPDERLNRLAVFVAQEMAMLQALQAKTFGRLLDILEMAGMPSAAGAASDEAEGKHDGQNDEAGSGSCAADVGSGSGSSSGPGPADAADAGASGTDLPVDPGR